jgi:hypothetical protein
MFKLHKNIQEGKKEENQLFWLVSAEINIYELFRSRLDPDGDNVMHEGETLHALIRKPQEERERNNKAEKCEINVNLW